MLPTLATRSIKMEKVPATASKWFVDMGGRKCRNHLPKDEFRIRSGSAAKAKNGKIEVTPTN
jgi:hypothetical protein